MLENWKSDMYPKSDGLEEDSFFQLSGCLLSIFIRFQGSISCEFQDNTIIDDLKNGWARHKSPVELYSACNFCYKKPAYINFQWNIYVPGWIHGNCIFAYIDPKQQKVRKYTIHKWYGCCFLLSTLLDATKST